MTKGGKTVAFKPAPSKLPAAAENWVTDRGTTSEQDREGGTVTPLKAVEAQAPAAAPPKEKMSRLTIDLPETLHRRVKMQCAGRGIKMVDVVRDFLEREFPEA